MEILKHLAIPVVSISGQLLLYDIENTWFQANSSSHEVYHPLHVRIDIRDYIYL